MRSLRPTQAGRGTGAVLVSWGCPNKVQTFRVSQFWGRKSGLEERAVPVPPDDCE